MIDMNINFTKIAAKYEDYSSVQRSAAEVLLKLLEIGKDDDVLDLGCGVGHLARKIKELTNGKIVGVDPAEGMIREAVEKSGGFDITFERLGLRLDRGHLKAAQTVTIRFSP